MSIKKIFFSAIILGGVSVNPCFSEAMDADTKQYCDKKCTAKHCGTFPSRAYDCGITCGDTYFEACLSGIKNADFVANVRQHVASVKQSQNAAN